MADLSKITNKFDLQKIIGDVKSMISPEKIPEANKDDPVAYCLAEISKGLKDLAELHAQQADTIAKINTMLGTLHQEITKSHTGSPGEAQQATPAVSEEAKAPEKDSSNETKES